MDAYCSPLRMYSSLKPANTLRVSFWNWKMDGKIKGVLNRLETNKNLDELKAKLGTLCRLLVEAFDLDKCLCVFHELNPLLDCFVVSFPPSEYENMDEELIIGIEGELRQNIKDVTVIDLMYKSHKIGAFLLIPKQESVIQDTYDSDGVTLNELADKCASAIVKQAVFVGKVFSSDFIRKLVAYKNKVKQGFEIDPDIIFDLLMMLIVPTRVYITCQIDDDNFIYNQFLAADGIIKDRSQGTFKADSFDFVIDEIIEDEPGIMSIEIKDKGKMIGMLMVAFERSGSAIDEEIERTLLALSSNLASLLILNHVD